MYIDAILRILFDPQDHQSLSCVEMSSKRKSASDIGGEPKTKKGATSEEKIQTINRIKELIQVGMSK